MSGKKKNLWIFSFILIYIAVAIAGFLIFYIVKKDFLYPNPKAPQATIISPVPTIPGWKTYTNTENNISFTYPTRDTLQSKSYGFGVTSVTLQTTGGNSDFQVLILPQSLAQAVGQDFSSYYSMQDNTSKVIKSPLSQDNNTNEAFTKIRNRSVDGLEAVDYQSIASNAPAGAKPEIGTFIQAGNNLILFSTGESNKMKLEQIVSSFHYQ
jgi:hypothetical protein